MPLHRVRGLMHPVVKARTVKPRTIETAAPLPGTALTPAEAEHAARERPYDERALAREALRTRAALGFAEAELAPEPPAPVEERKSVLDVRMNPTAHTKVRAQAETAAALERKNDVQEIGAEGSKLRDGAASANFWLGTPSVINDHITADVESSTFADAAGGTAEAGATRADRNGATTSLVSVDRTGLTLDVDRQTKGGVDNDVSTYISPGWVELDVSSMWNLAPGSLWTSEADNGTIGAAGGLIGWSSSIGVSFNCELGLGNGNSAKPGLFFMITDDRHAQLLGKYAGKRPELAGLERVEVVQQHDKWLSPSGRADIHGVGVLPAFNDTRSTATTYRTHMAPGAALQTVDTQESLLMRAVKKVRTALFLPNDDGPIPDLHKPPDLQLTDEEQAALQQDVALAPMLERLLQAQPPPPRSLSMMSFQPAPDGVLARGKELLRRTFLSKPVDDRIKAAGPSSVRPLTQEELKEMVADKRLPERIRELLDPETRRALSIEQQLHLPLTERPVPDKHNPLATMLPGDELDVTTSADWQFLGLAGAMGSKGGGMFVWRTNTQATIVRPDDPSTPDSVVDVTIRPSTLWNGGPAGTVAGLVGASGGGTWVGARRRTFRIDLSKPAARAFYQELIAGKAKDAPLATRDGATSKRELIALEQHIADGVVETFAEHAKLTATTGYLGTKIFFLPKGNDCVALAMSGVNAREQLIATDGEKIISRDTDERYRRKELLLWGDTQRSLMVSTRKVADANQPELDWQFAGQHVRAGLSKTNVGSGDHNKLVDRLNALFDLKLEHFARDGRNLARDVLLERVFGDEELAGLADASAGQWRQAAKAAACSEKAAEKLRVALQDADADAPKLVRAFLKNNAIEGMATLHRVLGANPVDLCVRTASSAYTAPLEAARLFRVRYGEAFRGPLAPPVGSKLRFEADQPTRALGSFLRDASKLLVELDDGLADVKDDPFLVDHESGVARAGRGRVGVPLLEARAHVLEILARVDAHVPPVERRAMFRELSDAELAGLSKGLMALAQKAEAPPALAEKMRALAAQAATEMRAQQQRKEEEPLTEEKLWLGF